MKFQTNDILENRHGTKVLITQTDPVNQGYHYKYLFTSNPQFQGPFYHSADEIERFWSLAGKNLALATGLSPQDLHGPVSHQEARSNLEGSSKSCVHEWATYTGVIHQYQYCKKCDQKLET